jgi:hypothetical protein
MTKRRLAAILAAVPPDRVFHPEMRETQGEQENNTMFIAMNRL